MLRALILSFLTVASVAPAMAQPAGTERGNTMQVYIREPGEGPVSEDLDLPLNKAAVVHLPVDVADVLVTDRKSVV